MSRFPLIFVQSNSHFMLPISGLILEAHFMLKDCHKHDISIFENFLSIKKIVLFVRVRIGITTISVCKESMPKAKSRFTIEIILAGNVSDRQSNLYTIFHVTDFEIDRTACF